MKCKNFPFENLSFIVLSFRKKLGSHLENITQFRKESHTPPS